MLNFSENSGKDYTTIYRDGWIYCIWWKDDSYLSLV